MGNEKGRKEEKRKMAYYATTITRIRKFETGFLLAVWPVSHYLRNRCPVTPSKSEGEAGKDPRTEARFIPSAGKWSSGLGRGLSNIIFVNCEIQSCGPALPVLRGKSVRSLRGDLQDFDWSSGWPSRSQILSRRVLDKVVRCIASLKW